ncbi:type II toxin-antitoxin system RelE/ParE family toxin [Psychroflexus planctonicus]|uniref:Type II toxin-antitoxin system RelE/ParE family toxin n=1 Tax=Psychroflexus planctonicus TaxID=1526575 RepID=A0ABQ1SKV4_9FLAO|nr:type II toxin-antitoxin system RelE/ParE family toxin [Psychroflexus planctonicus]GGE40437.1 hypothetical protein GCM10010832_20700 [Psychroflexus planctonicus]
MVRKVVWRKIALQQLHKQYEHIKKDSLQAAQKVRDDIFEMTDSLSTNPEIYPLDQYRKNNKGDIRAFEKYSLRVAYQITNVEVRILRVRHTSRLPLLY